MKLAFIITAILIWYSIIMGLTTFGFILDGFMLWKEPNRVIAIIEFSLTVGIFSLAIYFMRFLLKGSK